MAVLAMTEGNVLPRLVSKLCNDGKGEHSLLLILHSALLQVRSRHCEELQTASAAKQAAVTKQSIRLPCLFEARNDGIAINLFWLSLNHMSTRPKGDKNMPLYICATPIGNLEDITLRVLRTLKEVDLIAAEDTRYTIKLLNYYNIKTPLTSYHEHNKHTKGLDLVKQMQQGKSIALVSDNGLPSISDPGQNLISLCYQAEIAVTICPGASAGISALVLSGISSQSYTFIGFLPGLSEKKARKAAIEGIAAFGHAVILYEAPHRLLQTLSDLHKILGECNITIVRELTKKFEEVKSGSINNIIAYYKENPPKGEFVVIVECVSEITVSDIIDYPSSVKDHMKLYLNQGQDEKQAMKSVAKDRNISKSIVYSQYKIQRAEKA